MRKYNDLVIAGWFTAFVAGALVFGLLASNAAGAQGRGRGRGPGGALSLKDAKAAWTLEAEHLAGKLGLQDEAAGKLAKAYVDARKGFEEGMAAKRREIRSSADGRDEMRAAYREAYGEVLSGQREKLSKALSDFLAEEQAKKALAHLSGFNRSLDHMVHVLAGLDLGENKTKAFELVFAFSHEQAKLRQSGEGADRDFGEIRGKMREMKTKLDTDLGDVLSNAQMAVWKEATTYRGRRSGGRGEGGRRQRRGASQSSESTE